MEDANKAVVIGAGFGGLASAIRLAAAGFSVTLLEQATTPGGKARCLPSVAGPVDAGPTVLTLRDVFDALFALNDEALSDHVTLVPQPVLARHWWPDGATLDLHPDRAANHDAIRAAFGPREAEGFLRFDRLAEALYAAFEAPVMRAGRPALGPIARAALRQPRLWPALLPGVTLDRLLRHHFRDPRLVQLFGRYATYVGGRPTHVPAVLALVWRAEAAGVWAVSGGMQGLAWALADLAARMGVSVQYGTQVQRLIRQGGRIVAVQTAEGRRLPCAVCVFNGDPGALAFGLLGNAAKGPPQARPSLSARVWAFAARAEGPRAAELIHHNVFFTARARDEWQPLGRGRMPRAQTLYLCAEDRLTGPTHTGPTPIGPERFEIILNAPAGLTDSAKDHAECRTRMFQTLQRMGLTLDPMPGLDALTTPAAFARLFPGSQGALYGATPEGMAATFTRPQARTDLAGLYLAGGGTHPGAGVPMAALSGQHAVAAILQDRISGSRSPRTDTPGGMSMASRMTVGRRSRS